MHPAVCGVTRYPAVTGPLSTKEEGSLKGRKRREENIDDQ
jgi:hypothetical protein